MALDIDIINEIIVEYFQDRRCSGQQNGSACWTCVGRGELAIAGLYHKWKSSK